MYYFGIGICYKPLDHAEICFSSWDLGPLHTHTWAHEKYGQWICSSIFGKANHPKSHPCKITANRIHVEWESLAGTQIMHQIKIISLKTKGLFEDHQQKTITPVCASESGRSGCGFVWESRVASSAILAAQICSATALSEYFWAIWPFVIQTRAPCLRHDFLATIRSYSLDCFHSPLQEIHSSTSTWRRWLP